MKYPARSALKFARRAACRLTLLFVAFAVMAPVLAVETPAEAQGRRTLFDFLFGEKNDEPRRERAAPRKRQQPRQRVRRAPAPQRAVPEVKEKIENARVVLVVGDFIAGGLAQGLREAYAESPGIKIVDRANGSSGLVRDDYYDWPANIAPIIEEEDPTAVVVMIGSNDRQEMVVDGARRDPRSEAWTKQYTERVTQIAEAVRAKNLPLVWVGMPSFKFSSMTSDMLAFNDIYRNIAEQAGGEFVDIWEGFVNESGAFVTSGPDINGQNVQLRSSDGINLTGAGKRKIAFYVEKPLNRILGNAVSPEIEQLGPEYRPNITLNPEDETIDRTVPISFGDPELDGGTELLGADPGRKNAEEEELTPAEELAVKGIAPPVPAGRADDFSLGPKPAAATAAAGEIRTGPETTTAIGE